ncbi:hypothetical protein [Halalkalibacter alkaliphilus]|uniref:Uncharacterized protein n=1 Tax=Halalkalibacter alkaliphilus TaxID=2917993 RepID=A0A9X2I9U2_9BACI|nr:hypothetical protein [Halalkalibacter alkaliphilus]MCL7748945.1 hypothetical protein [Halalkalibacter alkaliphilus]
MSCKNEMYIVNQCILLILSCNKEKGSFSLEHKSIQTIERLTKMKVIKKSVGSSNNRYQYVRPKETVIEVSMIEHEVRI